MAAAATETRAELIERLNTIRAELEVMARDGKTEENSEEARALEEQADLVMDVLDMEKIAQRRGEPTYSYEEFRKEWLAD